MFTAMVAKSFIRNFRKKIMAIVAISLGASLVAAMLNLWLDVGDKMGKELKSYGSNIIVKPKAQALPFDIGLEDYDPLKGAVFIDENELPKIKTIFWRNNIIGFAPNLEARAKIGDTAVTVIGTWFNKRVVIPTGETVFTGVKTVSPWWEIDGSQIDESSKPKASKRALIIGKQLSEKLSLQMGDKINLSFNNGKQSGQYVVSGILSTGGSEENKIYMRLDDLQESTGLHDKVAWIEVSALTTPENELSKRHEKDEKSLSSTEAERWYCTAFVGSIAYQIEEAISGIEAKPLRQVSESESMVLNKLQLLVLLLAFAGITTSYLGVLSLMSAAVLERSREIGLEKALGATDASLARFFLAEASIVGILGGFIGYIIGLLLVQVIGMQIFGRMVDLKIGVMPVTVLMAVIVALIGNLSMVKAIARLNPKDVLYGR